MLMRFWAAAEAKRSCHQRQQLELPRLFSRSARLDASMPPITV